MKAIKLICLLLLLGMVTNAQISKLNSTNLSVGADFNFAERNLNITHQRGIGVTVKSEYVFAKHASATLSVGYVSFYKNKLSNVDVQQLSGIPIKAGLRYYLGNFYVASDAGIVIKTGFLSGNAFAYSFSVGDEIITSKRNQNSLDISLRDEGWIRSQPYNFIGLRLAYEFRIK